MVARILFFKNKFSTNRFWQANTVQESQFLILEGFERWTIS